MQAISFSDLRKDMKRVMDTIRDRHEPTIITRKDGNMVLMSLEDYSGLEETAYLLKSPKNAERIFTSIKEVREGEGQKKSLVEL